MGDTVIYVDNSSKSNPAMVLVGSDPADPLRKCKLWSFGSQSAVMNVSYSTAGTAGTWHWPDRTAR